MIVYVVFMVIGGTVGSNIYDKLSRLNGTDVKYFDAKYHSYFDVYSEYVYSIERTIAVYTYHSDILSNYRINIIPDVKIWINPCVYDISYCKIHYKNNSSILTDHPIIEDNDNLIVAWVSPVYTYQCSVEFMLKRVCGYYIEIHRPLDETVE